MLILPIAVAALPASVAQAPQTDAVRYDNRGRPVIAVKVNARGPFDMVVDTAAQTSLIAPALAAELGIAAMDETMAVNGATGSTRAQVYPVDRFASGLFDEREIGILAFPNPESTPARGIVGMDLFADRKLVFDRAAGRIAVLPSAPATDGFVAHRGEVRGGTLLLVPLILDGVSVKALIDTGAAVSIANPAARKALGWAADDPRLVRTGAISGATSAGAAVSRAEMATFKLGPVTLRRVPLLFSDRPIAESIARSDEPMVIIGADLLNLLDAYAVDFPRAELQIRIPRPPAR
ncbi:MAG: retroviral-like aspartic protease family protein [Sphingomonas taxi]